MFSANASVRNRHPRLFASTTLFHRALRAISTNHFQAPVRRFILDLFDVQLTPHTLSRLAHMERGAPGSLDLRKEHRRTDSKDSTSESRRRSQSSPRPEPRFERLSKLDEIVEAPRDVNLMAAPALPANQATLSQAREGAETPGLVGGGSVSKVAGGDGPNVFERDFGASTVVEKNEVARSPPAEYNAVPLIDHGNQQGFASPPPAHDYRQREDMDLFERAARFDRADGVGKNGPVHAL